MKSRNKVAIRHAVLVMAACGMAAVGFVFIMDTLTARTVGFQYAFGQHAPAPGSPGR